MFGRRGRNASGSECTPLRKQISFRRSNQVPPAPHSFGYRQASQNRGGYAIEFAHHEPPGSGELVGEGNYGRLERCSMRIALAPIVDQRRYSSNAECDVDQALAPRTPKSIRNDDRDVDAERSSELLLKSASRSVRVLGQQRGLSAGNV
jgi:hypothetical protein